MLASTPVFHEERTRLLAGCQRIERAFTALARRVWLNHRSQSSAGRYLTSQIRDSFPPAENSREKLALVIPTLCEAENIAAVIDNVRSVIHPLGIPYEIVVVDDDSQDGTGDIVAAIARQDAHVRLLVRKGQRGLSGAVLHGWRTPMPPSWA